MRQLSTCRETNVSRHSGRAQGEHWEPSGLTDLWAKPAAFPLSCVCGGSGWVRWGDVHLICTRSLATILVATQRPARKHTVALREGGRVPAPAPAGGSGGTAQSGRPSSEPPLGGRDEVGAGDGTEGEPALVSPDRHAPGRARVCSGRGQQRGSKTPELPGQGSTLQVGGSQPTAKQGKDGRKWGTMTCAKHKGPSVVLRLCSACPSGLESRLGPRGCHNTPRPVTSEQEDSRHRPGGRASETEEARHLRSRHLDVADRGPSHFGVW